MNDKINYKIIFQVVYNIKLIVDKDIGETIGK